MASSSGCCTAFTLNSFALKLSTQGQMHATSRVTTAQGQSPVLDNRTFMSAAAGQELCLYQPVPDSICNSLLAAHWSGMRVGCPVKVCTSESMEYATINAFLAKCKVLGQSSVPAQYLP